jgi:hypothetical protein
MSSGSARSSARTPSVCTTILLVQMHLGGFTISSSCTRVLDPPVEPVRACAALPCALGRTRVMHMGPVCLRAREVPSQLFPVSLRPHICDGWAHHEGVWTVVWRQASRRARPRGAGHSHVSGLCLLDACPWDGTAEKNLLDRQESRGYKRTSLRVLC